MTVFRPRRTPLGRREDLLESLRFTVFRMKDYRPIQVSVPRRTHPRQHIPAEAFRVRPMNRAMNKPTVKDLAVIEAVR